MEIIKAINDRNTISFDYRDEENHKRTMRIGEPYVIYPCGAESNMTLDFYQTDGESQSGFRTKPWKHLLLKNISNVRINIDQVFTARDDYNPNYKGYRYAIAKVIK